jgi:putative tricarboxylic transport membrane protein
MDNTNETGVEPASVGTRWPELIVGLALLGIGITVVVDSVRVGTGWADDGPRSGYFPFYIGLFLSLAAASIVIRQLLGWARDNPVFAEHTQLKSVWSIAWPMTLYVAAIGFLGIYVSSFLLITWFMKRHGTWGWPSVLALATGVPLAFFLVFEKWFLVLLPKGPLEAALGL